MSTNDQIKGIIVDALKLEEGNWTPDLGAFVGEVSRVYDNPRTIILDGEFTADHLETIARILKGDQ